MDELITEAQTLVLQYGDYVQEQNLDAILASVCEDAYFEILNRNPITGKEAIREFYENNFTSGDFSFNVNITDGKAVSEVVFINGVMDRIYTPEGQTSESMKLNFSFVLKKEEGRLKIWQCRFARLSDENDLNL